MNTFYIYVSLIAIFDLMGSMLAKMWAMKENPLYLIGTIFCFGIAGFFFAKSLKFEGLAVANIIWIVLSIVIVSIASYFFFHENLSRVQILGILTVLIGVVLVNLKSA